MIRVNIVKPPKMQAVTLSRQDLVKIGGKVVDTVQKRCGRGLDVNDRGMKPLSASYRAKKIRMGQPGIRNMMFSGAMLGSLTIVEADQAHVTIGFTRQAELAKAAKNDDRSKWFGISKNDQAVVLNYADQLLTKSSDKQ